MQTFARLVSSRRQGRARCSAADTPSAKQARTVIDGGGKYVLPGLTDAHGHVLGLGERSCRSTCAARRASRMRCERVRKHVAANPERALGHRPRLEPGAVEGATLPDCARARCAWSRIVPSFMSRVDGHAIWVNSAALKVAGITAATADPAGRPDRARCLRPARPACWSIRRTTLIEQHIPAATDAEVKRQLLAAMSELASLGMTGVHDAGIDARTYRLYQRARRRRAAADPHLRDARATAPKAAA